MDTHHIGDPTPVEAFRRFSRVARRLRTLVTELQAEGDWPEVRVDGLLLVYDIMLCIELKPDEMAHVLGRDGLDYVTTVIGE